MLELISNKATINRSELFVTLYVLHTIRLFNFLPYVNLHNILFAIDIIFAAYFFFCFLREKKKFGCTRFELATAIMYIVFLCSIPIGLKNGQQVDRVLKYTSMVFLQFSFFYYLKQAKIKTSFLMKLLWGLLIGYVVITILCYLLYPYMIFGGNDEQSLARMKDSIENRGVIRFTLPCKMLIPLFLLLTTQNYKNIKRAGLRILILLILLLFIGNRFPLLVALLVVGLMIFKSSDFSYSNKVKMMVASISLAILLFIIPVTRGIIDNLLMVTMAESDEGAENNIRVLSAMYFFTEFNEDNIEACVIGNGVNSNGPDAYSQRMKHLNEDLGYWEGDVGYSEIYIYFGIFGLLALAYWCYGAYKIKIETRYKYIKYYFLFLMLSMICGAYWFENFYVVSMLSYILVVSNRRVCVNQKYLGNG